MRQARNCRFPKNVFACLDIPGRGRGAAIRKSAGLRPSILGPIFRTDESRHRRKQPGSKRRAQAKKHVNKYQCRTAAIREHRLHEVANLLVKNHDRLVIETLYVAGMLANHCLAKALSDAAFGKLAWMLRYKAAWYGSVLVEADRWYPSSKICSGCGHRKKTLPLSERMFRCEECGSEIDRDLNAAINLARLGRELLERLGRGQAPDPGPVSSGPGEQRATQAPQRHRHATTDAAATEPSTPRTHHAA
jgi:putative transposase